MGLRSGICVAIGGGEDTCGIEDQTWLRKSGGGGFGVDVGACTVTVNSNMK